jgi:tetratricopeptide (TPR) repeat protein
LNNYAINLAWTSKKKKDKYLAINLFKESLNYPMPRKLVRAEVYGNIANIYSNMNLNMRALPYYDKALKLDNRNTKIRFDYIKLLFLLGKIEEADKNADILISSNVKNPDYYNLKGFILLWKKQEIEALQYFQKALNFDPYNYKNILINTGFALSELGFYKKAEWFYKYSVKYKPQTDVYEIFLLIENSIKSGDLKKADSFTDILFDNFSIYQILSDLKKIEKIKTHPPLKKSNFDFFIKEKIIKTIEKAENKKVF